VKKENGGEEVTGVTINPSKKGNQHGKRRPGKKPPRAGERFLEMQEKVFRSTTEARWTNQGGVGKKD